MSANSFSNYSLRLFLFLIFFPAISSAQTPTPTIGDGMLASYYNNTTLTGTPAYTRIEESSNYNWFNCSPEYSVIQPNNFSARFTGFLVPPLSTTYTFTVIPENGGVSLTVNNNILIPPPPSSWPGPFSATYTASLTLPASTPVPIEMDFTKTTGNAALNLSWNYPGSPGGIQLININYLYSGQPENPIPPAQTAVATGIACEATTMVEDGIFSEPAWQGSWTAATKTVDGSTSGTSAQFRTLWDNEYLYVGVTVIKSGLFNNSAEIYNNDSVEVFLNTSDTLTATNQPDDFAFLFGWNNPVVSERLGRVSGVLFSTAAISNGYTLEAAIPWATLSIPPSAGTTLGFDLAVNEGDASGCRAGELIWNGGFFDTVDSRTFGLLALAACSVPPLLTTPYVSPNPFTPGLLPNNQAYFNLSPYHGSGHLVIADLRRRKIRSIDFQSSQELIWDGRDDSGNLVPPGVYVFILQVDGAIHRSTVTVMR
jgi:hypothetical protein